MNGPVQSVPKSIPHYRNWISLSGAVIATGSLFSFVFLFAIDLFAHHGNPYMGILAYVVAPMFFVLGVILWVLGIWIHRLRTKAAALPHAITIDLSRPRDKK